MNPTAHPPALVSPAMTYDEQSDRVILFGGSYDDETWAYDYNTNTWTQMNPAARPPGLVRHTLTYDAGADRAFLFGGVGGDLRLSETWVYDFDNDTWTNRTPTDRPPERLRYGLAYDAESDRVILFGGSSPNIGGYHMDDTWAYDVDAGTWTKMNPTVKPSRRSEFAMAYDAGSDRVILMGGASVGSGGPLTDTWAYDFNTDTWQQRSSPSGMAPIVDHAMAYDAESDRIILFGNQGTWAYDYESDTWTDLRGPGEPPGRQGAQLAYDAESDRVILFGGYTGPPDQPLRLDDTWAYDFNTNTWENMNPTTRPQGRYGFAMTYDASRDRVVLFGGSPSAGQAADDTWTYDFNTNTWSQVSMIVKPSARVEHQMAYDAQSGRTILFSGFTTADGLVDDLWSLTLAP